MSSLPARRKVEAAKGPSLPPADVTYTAEEDGGEDEPGTASGGPPTHDPDAWKVFGRDTEAGRMLAKLYAKPTKPSIAYPKPKLKPRNPEETPAFLPAGGKADVDYRNATRKEGAVAVPRVGGPKIPSFAPIELRVGQGVMAKSEIDSRIEEEARTGDRPQPPVTKAISTESEKRKLQAAFQFKGGKALPDELTLAPIEGHVPLRMISSDASAAKRKEAALRAGRTGGGGDGKPVTQAQLIHQMILDISEEIAERQSHLDEMRRLGASNRDTEALLSSEISQRVAELNRLNAQLDTL